MTHTTLHIQSHRKLKWKLRCRELYLSTWVGICQTNCDGPESYPREVAPYTWLPHATETGVSYKQQLCLSILRLKSFLCFSIAERKAPDSLSTDLVNGDHLSIPGMHDYAYGSLGTYNQMSPSPKSVAPQSPSSAPRSYTLGEQTQLTAVWEPLHLNISMHILLTLLYKFPLVLPGRISLSIKIFSLWSFPLFSWPYCVI